MARESETAQLSYVVALNCTSTNMIQFAENTPNHYFSMREAGDPTCTPPCSVMGAAVRAAWGRCVKAFGTHKHIFAAQTSPRTAPEITGKMLLFCQCWFSASSCKTAKGRNTWLIFEIYHINVNYINTYILYILYIFIYWWSTHKSTWVLYWTNIGSVLGQKLD